MKNKRVLLCFNILIIVILSGCAYDKKPLPNVDYVDWYRDINDTGTYNYPDFLEMDVWFVTRTDSFDWAGVTFDVNYEGEEICSDLDVVVKENYIICFFDNSCLGCDEWFLAPGKYEFILKDSYGVELVSSNCIVTADSGDQLSELITDICLLDRQDNLVSIEVKFNSDITPYTRRGFLITVSADGELVDITDRYSIEQADTYLIIVCDLPEVNSEDVVLSVFSGDGIYICDTRITIAS